MSSLLRLSASALCKQSSLVSLARCMSQMSFGGSSAPTLPPPPPPQPPTTGIDGHNRTTSIVLPSGQLFKWPLADLRIVDALTRLELTLPELDKHTRVIDPLVKERSASVETPPPLTSRGTAMHCRRWKPRTEKAWRSRKMNIHKRRKYRKKMFFMLVKREQAKAKRYQNLCDMLARINEKRVELFEPLRYIKRELEKASFFGYRCSPDYETYRRLIDQRLVTFDPKYTRKFEDTVKPYHMLYAEEDPDLAPVDLKAERKKRAAAVLVLNPKGAKAKK